MTEKQVRPSPTRRLHVNGHELAEAYVDGEEGFICLWCHRQYHPNLVGPNMESCPPH